jgi:hypothetical protein
MDNEISKACKYHTLDSDEKYISILHRKPASNTRLNKDQQEIRKCS